MVSYHHIIPRSGGFQHDEGLQKLSHTCTKCLTLCLWVEMVYKHRLGSSVSTSKMLFAMISRSGGPWRRGNDLSAPPLYRILHLHAGIRPISTQMQYVYFSTDPRAQMRPNLRKGPREVKSGYWCPNTPLDNISYSTLRYETSFPLNVPPYGHSATCRTGF